MRRFKSIKVFMIIISFLLIGCQIGTNGANGLDGKDGISIVWLGSFASEKDIYNPKILNAYFNTTDGCSYIYDGTKWVLLAKAGMDSEDGIDGQDGKDGISIVWLGSFASAKEIEKPKKLNAYFNTTDGCSYIYDGTKWTLLAKSGRDSEDGKDGEDGQNGISIVWLGSFASEEEIEDPKKLNAYFNTTNGCSYIYDGTKWTLLAKSGNTEIYDASLEISSLPTKLNYYKNEILNLDGLIVRMNRTDGTSNELSTDEFTVYPEQGTVLAESGNQMIRISANNKTAVFVISVIDKPVVTVDTIILNTSSVNRYYGIGECLDLSALKISALYSDGTSKEITNYISIPNNGSQLNKIGMQTVTILAEGKSASFDIQVLSDTSIYAQVSYEIYSDIENLLSYDSLTNTFTALPNYDSYRWFVDDTKQEENTNIFVYEDCQYHTITVIVNAAGKKYSAQMRIE